jgi:hypothetical protein
MNPHFKYKCFEKLEPTGQSSPKLNGDGWQRVKADAGIDLALLCEAQANERPLEKLLALTTVNFFL